MPRLTVPAQYVTRILDLASTNLRDQQLDVKWLRAGNEELNLFDKLKIKDFLGEEGSFTFTLSNTSIVMTRAGFHYDCMGAGLTVDIDPFIIPEDLIDTKIVGTTNVVGGPMGDHQKVGFAPLLALYFLFEIIAIIWTILHTEIDLVLSDNNTTTINYSNGVVSVKFSSPPKLRVNAKGIFGMTVDVQCLRAEIDQTGITAHTDSIIIPTIKFVAQ